MKNTTRAFDAVNRRESFSRSFLALFAIFAALVLLIPTTGCKREKPTVEYGGGQIATAQERKQQYRNLVDQVVQAAEAQEKYPDQTYLRGALGRLNTWLAEEPEPKDFSPDPEYDALVQKFTELVATAQKCDELFTLFADETKTVQEKDCDELETTVKSFKAQIAPLVSETTSATLGAFELFADEILEKLASAREFQFADPTESFKTQIRQLASAPSFGYYNFATLRSGLEDYVRLLKIDGKVFLPQDADFLRSVVWFRDVFSWAKGPKQDDMTIVKELFDWTVKNVVLAEPLPTPMGLVSQLEWQTLLLGQGTPMDRAIVFIELLRQHRLDAFVVRPDGELRNDFPVVVGVRYDGEVYLFDVGLGLPFAAASEVSLDDKEGLVVNKVATLRDVAADDSILRRFDLPERPYPATSDDFKRVVAYAPSTPFQVASRMIPLEQEFSGNVNTVLSTPFDVQKERIAEVDGIVDVKRLQEANAPILEQTIFPEESDYVTRVFMTPMETTKSLEITGGSESSSAEEINDYTGDSSEQFAGVSGKKQTNLAPLWIGKILYLRGVFVDEGAARWLLQCRVSERLLKSQESSVRARVADFLKEYSAWAEEQGQTLGDDDLRRLATETAVTLQAEIALKRFMKVLAGYNLALLSEETGADAAALERLNDESLRPGRRSGAQGLVGDEFRNAANYLRARILEKQASWAAAAARLRAGLDFGSRVRAKWIAELAGLATEEATPETPSAEEPADETSGEEEPTAEDAPSDQAPAVETPTTDEPAATDAEPATEAAVSEESAASAPETEETTTDAAPSDPSEP